LGCRVETRRLGSVSQDTGRPRSDPGRTTPGRTMASRYSAPAKSRGHVTPVRQAKGAKPACKTIGNRCLPPPAPVSAFRPGSQHSKMSRISPAKSKLPIWQVSSRPNPASIKNQKNTLLRSDTTDPRDGAFRFKLDPQGFGKRLARRMAGFAVEQNGDDPIVRSV
jgi:hypothetical protein